MGKANSLLQPNAGPARTATGLAEVDANGGTAGHSDVPLEDQIVPLRPGLLLHGRKALMAALRR
eukprot:15459639-Alexandrium_andersonii.AAC.1